ncbi:hypothetical protein [Amycolatopsis plumensis]|uniref:Uncharacterized protein n=1 Tax=Amycolatopsis plumensis TaxID=236508 RepID=A0ABV5U003_9PSEU
MTDLERKLAETLREQAGEVTPNLEAAWAEQVRRQQKPRRRRAAVWAAPLAAVLVVLTSVLLATQLNTASVPPANPGEPLNLAKFTPRTLHALQVMVGPVGAIDFAGQSSSWTAYAFGAFASGGVTELLCVASVPAGHRLAAESPLYGIDSPRCLPIERLSGHAVRAGYIGEPNGPLPSGKAIFFVDPSVGTLQLFAANGDLIMARPVGRLSDLVVFAADVPPGSPPVRFRVS